MIYNDSLRIVYVAALIMPAKFLLPKQLGSNKAGKLFCAYSFTAGQFKDSSWVFLTQLY